MKTLLAFWNKDHTNKLIGLVVLGLALGGIALAILVARIPPEKSLRGAISGVFPALDSPFVKNPVAPIATPTPPATWMPHATRTPTPDPAGSAAGSATETLPLPPPSEEPTAIGASPTRTALDADPSACIPRGLAKIGRVVETLDGYTIKVLMDDRVYVVRYLGVIAPDEEAPFYQAAVSRNSELVFGHEVALLPGAPDKDPAGRLLRYVSVGDTFVNLTLLREGLARLDAEATELACGASFEAAQQAAQRDGAGQWSLGGPTRSP